MSEPFLAEIRIWAINYAPRGWAFCDGQLLPIANNTALFSLIGTTYGGDGRSTTAVPNLQGRAPMHPGRGPGLTARRLGEKVGVETVTLSEAQIPSHNHTWRGATDKPDTNVPTAAVPSRHKDNNIERVYSNDQTKLVDFASEQMANTGGGQDHENMQPYIGLNFCIALVGEYPSRN